MTENRAPLLFALLLLLFFVSTSLGFADISAIKNQIQSLQLKIIGEKLKALQQGVLGVDAGPPIAATPPLKVSAPEPTREELSRALERQIQIVQGVVATLQPQAVAESAARIEARIAALGDEVKKASGEKLISLQDEMVDLAAEHDVLEREVRQSLSDSIKYKQVQVIKEQILVLQEKIATLPRPSTVSNSAVQQQNAALADIQDNIQKLQLKILQAQVKVIQEKIRQITR